MRRLFLVLFVFLAVPVLAQTPTNLTLYQVEFDASGHDATALDGTALTTSFEFNAVAMNSVGAIALTVNLGKPTPVSGAHFVAPVPQLQTITPNTSYTATVKGIGPGGSAVSPPSNPFGLVVVGPPASPVNVSVR